MFKKINLYCSSDLPLAPFSHLLSELRERDYAFALTSRGTDGQLFRFFAEQHWPRRRTWFGPDTGRPLGWKLFRLISPLSRLSTGIEWWWNKKSLPATIICCGLPEKILLTPLAKLFRIKVLWLELPEAGSEQARARKLLARHSRHATMIAFNHRTKEQLAAAGMAAENIKVIQPGIKLQQFTHQDDLFHNLADRGHPSKKFFTVGTVNDLGGQQKIEALFQAIKKCLTIIPNIQLVVVGEGKEKKNLLWLAKKMEIDTLVWLVGEQKHLRKWLESFDLYAATKEQPDLAELATVLAAMSAERPVIAQAETGLEDLVFDGKTGYLLDLKDSETVAEKIIELYQDKRLRAELGRQGRERLEKYFTSAKMLEQFEKLL